MGNGGNGKDTSPTARAETVDAGSNPGAPITKTEAETDPLVGTVLDGRYHITRLIGEGGMGSVYEATHVELGKRVAVKVLRASLSNDAVFVERFRREARATSQLGHPGIVEVTDSGRTPQGNAYFVMEFLEGKDLANTLTEVTRLEVRRAVKIARQICDALETAHHAGVIHRDLKPENIFLARKNGDPEVVKIVDFGIALWVAEPSRLTQTGFPGTPEYMAPEQAGGPVDHRADIYALGVLLYEMLTGRPPHRGKNYMAVFIAKARRPTAIGTLRPEVPRELEAIIMDALATDPARRPQSMVEFGERLERCLRVTTPVVGPEALRAPTGAHPRTPTTAVGAEMLRTGLPRRTRRNFGTIALAVFTAAVVLGVVFYLHRMTPQVVRSDASGDASSGEKVGARQPNATPRGPVKRDPRRGRAKTGERAEPPKVAARASEPAAPSRAETPRSVDEFIALGRRELEAGRFGEATAAFNTARVLGAKGQALEGLAQVAFHEQRYEEARNLGRQAVKAGNRHARLVVAGSLFSEGRYVEAREEYERVLRDFPGNREATRNLEIARSRAGQTP